jgi:exonuclease VII large subunit
MTDRFTVTEVNDAVKRAITNEFKNKTITVIGEISNIKISGRNTWLTLKDEGTAIQVVFWGSALDNTNGDNVEIKCKVGYYAKTSNLNLTGQTIKIIGVGSLHTEYERLKDYYEKKGFFNNRKPLPDSVKNVGIVTSEGGAALQDFKYVLEKNNFSGNLYIYDCSVQGSRCPSTVVAGIRYFNSPFIANTTDTQPTIDQIPDKNDNSDACSDDSFDPFNSKKESKKEKKPEKETKKEKQKDNNMLSNNVEVDIIVISRGGGSFEDLMGFSHPKVVEEIYASKKYVISAVGHEIDTMLSDYVANYRAPTPSVAGAVICSINDGVIRKLEKIKMDVLNIKNKLLGSLYKYKDNLKNISNLLDDPTKIVLNKLETIKKKSKDLIYSRLIFCRKRLADIRRRATQYDIDGMMKNGVVVLTDMNGQIIHQISDILNKRVKLIHQSGSYDVQINFCPKN